MYNTSLIFTKKKKHLKKIKESKLFCLIPNHNLLLIESITKKTFNYMNINPESLSFNNNSVIDAQVNKILN